MCSQSQQKPLPDWSFLPADAIGFISSLIADDTDYVRFRSVCSSWRSAAPKRPLLPCLLVLIYGARATHPIGATLYNFPKSNFFRIPRSNFFPAPRLQDDMFRGKVICGSSFGWVAVLDDSQSISLHNPFIAIHINLPSLTNLPWINKLGCFAELLANKLVLSSDPRIPSCIALALSKCHNRLIYCCPGEGNGLWTALPPFIDNRDKLDDIIFYKGKFFAVQGYRVFICDILLHDTHVKEISPTNPFFSDGNLRDTLSRSKISHLVESSGDLLLVSVSCPHMVCDAPNCDGRDNFSFEVFRVHLDFTETPNGRLSLFKLNNLGGRNLFLGYNTLSVSAANSPYCNENCIFFISDDMAVFDDFEVLVFFMEDGTVSSFSESSHLSRTMHWLTPCLC